MFYKVQSNKSTNTFEIKTQNKMYGNRRAIGFLRDLKKTVSKRALKAGQDVQLKNIIDEIQVRASSKHPMMYRLQAKLNPWSKAYKIKHLSQDILKGVAAKSQALKVGFQQNIDDPFSYFAVPQNTLDTLKTLDAKPPNSLKRVIYFCPAENYGKDKFVYDVQDLQNRGLAVPITIEFDPTYSFLKLDDSFLETGLSTVSLTVFTQNYQKKNNENVAQIMQQLLINS